MRLGPFVKCFDYHGIFTGASGTVVGAYDFSSGSGQSLIYNILYSSGSHFSGDNFYGPVYPLLNVGATGSNGFCSGRSSYRIGYEVSGDYGLLIDFSYNNCSRTGVITPNVLFSTASGLSSITSDTFYIGIDSANQLFLSSQTLHRTLYSELKPRNLAFVNFGDQSTVEFGFFDPFTNAIVSESVELNNQKVSNTLYMGGVLSYANTGVAGITGLVGTLYNAVLFRKPIGFSEASGCLECIFAIDSGTGAPSVTTLSIPSITGYIFSGINETYITGIIPITGQILTSNNNILNIIFPSGQTGTRQAGEIASVLTGTISQTVTGDPVWIFTKSSDYSSFISYDIEFSVDLVSGDTLEIYTYSGFNDNVNHDVENLTFPISESFTQIIGNGLVETFDVDYKVENDRKISGFFDDDSLRYDYLNSPSIVTNYSGSWNRSKLPVSGGGYYPSTSQFNETIDSGLVILTGITGSYIPKDSDVYLNGQKLISGVHYRYLDDSISGFFGGQTGLNVVILNPQFLPDFTGEFNFTMGGLLYNIIDLEDSELAFLPNYGTYTRYYLDVTGTLSLYSGITGFSEQVWVNGVRQRLETDYTRNSPCVLTNGDISEPDLPFNFYNNQDTFLNIQ